MKAPLGEPFTRIAGDAVFPPLRHDWSVEEVLEILQRPLIELVCEAQAVHQRHHGEGTVQLAVLHSIKTSACPEDCKYCPQSAHYAKKTGLRREPLMDVDDVLEKARMAKQAGATRLCMGAAWRQVRDGAEFGESERDRAAMLQVLANMAPHPESVPINALVPVTGTQLGDAKPVELLKLVRMIATARIVMPQSRVRLSAGRQGLSNEVQMLCLMAGTNSIFYGEKLLATSTRHGR